MDVLLGAFINSALVVVGTFLGMILKKGISKNLQDGITKAMGLVVVYLSIDSMMTEASSMNVLLSMGIGTLIGEMLDLDGRMGKLGDWLQSKFSNLGEISVGFVRATILYCVGSMGILGCIESGLQNVHTTLTAKGIIDCVCSIFFAAEHGIGVAFSAIALFIYQGAITICAGFLAPVLTEQAIINQINCVGGIILLTVALNIIGIGKFKSMNFVPAIVVTVILTMLGI